MEFLAQSFHSGTASIPVSRVDTDEANERVSFHSESTLSSDTE